MSFRIELGGTHNWPNWVGRSATLIIFSFYPIGAVVRLVNADAGAQLLGLGMIVIAALVVAAFTATYSFQLTKEKYDNLDERERQVRNRAHAIAYGGVAAFLLLGLIYMQLADDFSWWIPTTREHWSAVFWGALIVASTLPAACLVWSEGAAERDDAGA